MDGEGLFGIDDYFSKKIKAAKKAAVGYAADKVAVEGTRLARQAGTRYLGKRAGELAGDFASEVLAPRAKAKLQELVGAGATHTVRQVLGTYRRWLAHGKQWDREKLRRKQGHKTAPLDREALKYHLALVGVDRDWDRERWSRTAMQKGLNARLRALFSKRTRKNEILQLIDLLDEWRTANEKTRGRATLVDMVQHEDAGIEDDYFEEYMPRGTDLTRVAKESLPAPAPRKRRAPSQYNLFMRDAIHRERAADPDIDARQAFRQAVQAWRDRGAPAANDDGLDIDSDDGDAPPRRVSAKVARKRVNTVFRRGVEGWRRGAQPRFGDGTPVDKDDLLAAVHNRLAHWSKTKTLKAPARALHTRLSTGKRLTMRDDELMDRVFVYMSARR